MAGKHEAKQGDTIISLAFANGLSAETVWNHPQNAEIKQKRENMNILLPGDGVFIPEIRVKELSEPTNRVHKYRCNNTPVKLRLQLLKEGNPRANEPYVLKVEELQFEGKLDGDGRVEQSISPDAKRGQLILNDGDEVFELRIGSLDPNNEISGVQGRLRHFGFYFGPIDGEKSPELDHAVQLFQISRDLEPNGELDARTEEELKRDYEG